MRIPPDFIDFFVQEKLFVTIKSRQKSRHFIL